MSEFEFLSVLVSIIFGLGLAHILNGAVTYIFKRQAIDVRLIYSAFILVAFILNWWVFFTWRDHEVWRFDDLLVLVFWAISHYIVAITLYRPDSSDECGKFELHWFLLAFAVMGFMDIIQTAMRGDLFRPWYYLLFVGHYIALAVVGFFVKSPIFHRVASSWCLISILVWAIAARRLLT